MVKRFHSSMIHYYRIMMSGCFEWGSLSCCNCWEDAMESVVGGGWG